MADLVITAGNVALTQGAFETGTAGAAVTAGQAVYLDPADNKLKLADNNAAGTSDTTKGIALHTSANGQPLAYAGPGTKLNLGATLVAGHHYFVSDTAGAIMPHADLSAAERVFRLGYAESTSIFVMDPKFLNLAIA